MTDLSPVKQALLQQRRLKARIEELERERREPIAVIGIGCRFPGGAADAPSFWRLLCAGTDAISVVPPDRFDLSACYDPDPDAPGKISTRFGGFLEGIDRFDAQLFGISPREAATMDPQQRLLLEVTWEALEHAGYAPDRMAGSPTGVFVGLCTNDYLQHYAQRGVFAEIDPYLATGSAHSVASGRISYLLGLHGPSLSLDTACSSSLVTVHTACESIRSGSCDMALAGGAGILLSLEIFVSLSKARMLSPDGRCKAFDAGANGFVRSEGCGMVVLKRLSAAMRDRDRILAVIRGSACNQDGRSNGLTAPNGPAQQAVIRAALANAGVDPRAMTYLEAHGTGTVLGDPIEVESLAAVLGQGRREGQLLFLGSVKTNLGHLEAAAGIAGFIKTVLALHHGAIPASLHFHTPNPHIAWDAYPFVRVPTTLTPWATDGGRRIAGVSAFGFSGTNAHVVLEEGPASQPEQLGADRPVHVVALSGKTAEALRVAARDLGRRLDGDGDGLPDVCYSVNTGRATLSHRALVVAADRSAMSARLRDVSEGKSGPGILSGMVEDGADPRVLFFFPERGAARLQAGRRLFETEPAFARALAECEEVLRPALGDGWLGGWRSSATALDAAFTEAVTFAVQYATAVLWRSWGVEPGAVLGQGTGEPIAAVIAGVLSIEDALRMVAGTRPEPSGPPSRSPLAKPPAVPFFSGVRGRRATASEVTSPSYWTDVPPGRTRGEAAIAAAVREGFNVVLEIGTGSAGALAPASSGACWVTSFDPGRDEWQSIAEALGRLYAAGVPIDWRAFDGSHGRSRVDVPASPRVREKYWFTERQPAGDAGNMSSWDAVMRAAARQASQVPIDLDLRRFTDLWGELDHFTTSSVARAVVELGLFTREGSDRTLDGAVGEGHVLPIYGRLLGLWFDRLVREGYLERRGETFVATAKMALATPDRREGPGPASQGVPVLRDYLERCDRQLAAIVSGRQGPLETLFPAGSFQTADFFYRDWSLARYYNGILAAIASALRNRADGGALRILEAGGGTGGTTMSLLPALSSGHVEYRFTDVSETFFERRDQELSNFPFVRYHRFDLDQDPGTQGLPTGQFDVVVAANALHAAKDLGKAIDHVRALLVPGGLLLLFEVTTHLSWFEMSIALIEGWQHHEDRLRADTPLLTPGRWAEVLRAKGFDRVAFFPPADSPATVLGHNILVAMVPGVPAAVRTPVAAVAAAGRGVQAPAPGEPAGLPAGGASSSVRDRLSGLTQAERRTEVQGLVQRHVARVMRLPSSAPPPGVNDRLMNIGVDSLMAVELRGSLVRALEGAVDLPSTLIFDHPTIAAIALHLLNALGYGSEPASATPQAVERQGGDADAAAIAGMSDAEVEALLAARLKELGK